MIIGQEYVNQLRLTRYNIKLALQPFKDTEAYPYLKRSMERLDMVISAEYDDGILDTVIDDLLHNARLLSRDMTTKTEQDDFKELHTQINMLDAISERINKRGFEIIDYTCYWSPKSEHTYCQHDHCIFNEEWMKNESRKIVLRNKIEEEKKIKQDNNMPNEDRLQAYKNIRKYEKELERLENVDTSRFQRKG